MGASPLWEKQVKPMNIVRQRMQDGIHGQTDGQTIYLDDRLSAVQMFCTVVHELVHVERGHSRQQPEQVETEVRYEAARRILAVEDMVGRCSGDLDDTARTLRVTRQVLMDRAVTLTDAQAHRVGCPECRACPAMAARFEPSGDAGDAVFVSRSTRARA